MERDESHKNFVVNPTLSAQSNSAGSIVDAQPKEGAWGRSIILGISLTLIYLVNRADPIGAEDTLPAQLLPVAVLRGDGIYLDRFDRFFSSDGNSQLIYSMKRVGRHIISRYPIGSVLLSLPVTAVQIAIIDRIDPGWDHNPGLEILRAQRTAKITSALIAALTGVMLYRLLRRLGVGIMAMPATLTAALGSNLWVIASQAPWEHGSAALMLTLSLFLLSRQATSKRSLLLAGTTTAMIVVCRPIAVVFALAIFLRVAWERPRDFIWFLPGPTILCAMLLLYNWFFFGSLAGGLIELEAMHPTLHNLPGTWSGRLGDGLAGTLFSPNRGLFVYSPWIFIALVTLPLTVSRIRAWSLGVWMVGALVVDLLILSKYSVWWAGHSFGPRYWTDAMPIFTVFFAFTLEWTWKHCRLMAGVCVFTIFISVVIQGIGAFCYPSSWEVAPIDVDRAPGRFWDWSDTELRRCLREGAHPWSTIKDPLWQKWFPKR